MFCFGESGQPFDCVQDINLLIIVVYGYNIDEPVSGDFIGFESPINFFRVI